MQPGTALLLLMAATLVSVQGVPLSAWTSGTASFFGGPQDSNSNAYKLTIDSGSCGYGDFDPRLYPLYHVVGLHKSNTLVANRPMDACGSCLEIQCVGDEKHCNSKQIIPMIITDQCAYNCDSTTINIHVFGFEEVAPLKLGRPQVRYRLVECEPTDPVTVHIMDYRANEGGWIRLALKNVAGDAALIKVELAAASQQNESGDPSAAGWMPFTNTYGAVWEAGIGGVTLPTPPLDLRITNSIGQQLIIKKFVSTAGMVGDVETTGQFPSPFGPSAATSSGNDFVPPTLKAVQPITVGTAIDKPRNTLYLSAMNATGPVDVPMPQQSKGTTTSPVNAGEDKPYPGGAAPTNNIVLSGNQASQGPPAQPTQSPNKTPPAQVPTNQQVPAPSPVHVPAPNNPASPPQRTPVPKPLPTFVSAAPGQHTSPRPSPVTAQPTYYVYSPSSVKEGAPGNTKQVVIARNGGTRRLLKV